METNGGEIGIIEEKNDYEKTSNNGDAIVNNRFCWWRKKNGGYQDRMKRESWEPAKD